MSGTIPVVGQFKDVLNLDCLMMGYTTPDNNAHGPDEKFRLCDFHAGIRSNVHLLEAAAGL